MPVIARISDKLSCDDVIKTASPDVYADGLPIARLNDITTGHSNGFGSWRSVKINTASENVFINNLPVARVGDTAEEHCFFSCHVGKIQNGSPTVFAN